MRSNNFKNKIIRFFVKGFFLSLFLLFISGTAFATEIYTPGETIVIGEFIYNDDYTPTMDDCTISIYGPAGGPALVETTMLADATGWHYYSYITPATEGKYPTFITCGSVPTGDLLKLDKTFILKASVVTDSSIASSVWSSSERTLTSFGTLVTDIWSSGTRTLSSFGTLVTDIWGSGTRTLTSFGTLVADIWSDIASPDRRLTSKSIAGGGSLATESYIDTSVATLTSEIQTTQSLVSALNNISAADVWTSATRSLTSDVNISASSVDEIWDIASTELIASGSIGKLIVDNLDAQISSRGISNLTAGDVWSSVTRTLTSEGVSSVATAVWGESARTLTDYGNDITASDVWSVLSSSLSIVGTIGEQVATNVDVATSSVLNNWSVKMGNVERIQAGYVYRTKVFILNANASPTAPFAVPTVTLYDANRNIVVSNIATTLISTGVYEYTYTVDNNAAQGLWETIVSTEVENGKTIQTNDYWEVSGSPAQVIINSVTSSGINSISGNITITNEGLSGYEYDYEWCVVTDIDNDCGGGDDSFYASAAKFINPSESWNTALTANVSTIGTYYFKLVVYFGTDFSSASRIFTVSEEQEQGGGGGGGGSVSPKLNASCNGADLNIDNVVDSIDFSILLYFWKTVFPFKNNCVDINADKKVDSIDFSIMLFHWGKKSI